MRALLPVTRLSRLAAAVALAATLGLGAVTSAHAARSSVSITTISPTTGGCITNPYNGTVTLDRVETGTLRLELFYQNGNQTKGFVDSGIGATATFANSATGTYSLSGTFPTGMSYRVDVLNESASSASFTSGDPLINPTEKSASVPLCSGGPGLGGGGSATPELGSGELLATGLLPIGAVLLYRRRRNRRAS